MRAIGYALLLRRRRGEWRCVCEEGDVSRIDAEESKTQVQLLFLVNGGVFPAEGGEMMERIV